MVGEAANTEDKRENGETVRGHLRGQCLMAGPIALSRGGGLTGAKLVVSGLVRDLETLKPRVRLRLLAALSHALCDQPAHEGSEESTFQGGDKAARGLAAASLSGGTYPADGGLAKQ